MTSQPGRTNIKISKTIREIISTLKAASTMKSQLILTILSR